MKHRFLSAILGALCIALPGMSSAALKKIPYKNPFNRLGLGRTHFIVGQPNVTELFKRFKHDYPNRIKTYFAPDDDVRQALIDLIGKETVSIKIAIYILTDTKIANALIDAMKRNVDLEIVTDVGLMNERSSKIGKLHSAGAKVYAYIPPPTGKSSLMHHKFLLFQKNKYVWTGSYNFSIAANERNQENAIVIYDENVYQDFLNQFERLKNRSKASGIRK